MSQTGAARQSSFASFASSAPSAPSTPSTPSGVVLAAAGAMALIGCVGGDSLPPRPPGPLASALLALAGELGADPQEVAATWTGVNEIARRTAARQHATGGDLADSLNAVVMGDLRFEREVDSTDLAYMRLPSVLSRRRGNCLGLGALYLIIAERLGQPLQGVLVPGHFFVRAPGPPSRNLELLRRGEAMPDRWYRDKYGPWPARDGASPGAYGRPLSILELGGLYWFNAGNQYRQEADVAAAERAYARAAADFPDLAEAHASLGAMWQLRGALADAARAYQAATRARADLPGLAQNVVLLEAEQAALAARPRARSDRDTAKTESSNNAPAALPSVQ